MLPFLALAQLAEELEAVHHGHHDVEHDELGEVLLHQLQGASAVLGDGDGILLVLDHARHHFAQHGVILHEEHVAVGRVTQVAVQHAAQQRGVHRLGEELGGAEGEPGVGLAILEREEDHGDGREVEVGLEFAHDGPAVGGRAGSVQRDEHGSEFACELDALSAAGRDAHFAAGVLDGFADELVDFSVRAEDEHDAGGERAEVRAAGRWGGGFGFKFLHLGGQLEGEGGAFAKFAGDVDVAAHQLAKLPRDDQAQAGAAVFA